MTDLEQINDAVSQLCDARTFLVNEEYERALAYLYRAEEYLAIVKSELISRLATKVLVNQGLVTGETTDG